MSETPSFSFADKPTGLGLTQGRLNEFINRLGVLSDLTFITERKQILNDYSLYLFISFVQS